MSLMEPLPGPVSRFTVWKASGLTAAAAGAFRGISLACQLLTGGILALALLLLRDAGLSLGALLAVPLLAAVRPVIVESRQAPHGGRGADAPQ